MYFPDAVLWSFHIIDLHSTVFRFLKKSFFGSLLRNCQPIHLSIEIWTSLLPFLSSVCYTTVKYRMVSHCFKYKHLSPRDTQSLAVTCYRLDGRGVGVWVPVGGWCFSSPRHPDHCWGSPSLLSNWYRGFYLGVKRPGREADHPSPTSAEVKKM
jgi:hypothetical protein